MADVVVCKNCGYSEADHTSGLVPEEDEDKVLPGRTYCLNACPGYYPDTPVAAGTQAAIPGQTGKPSMTFGTSRRRPRSSSFF